MPGAFATNIKFGRAGKELDLTASGGNVNADFGITVGRYEVENRNVQGETFTRVFRRTQPEWVLHLSHASTTMRDAIMSMYMIPDTHLSFIFADDWNIYSERYVSETTTGIYLRSNSYLLLDKEYSTYSLTAQCTNFQCWNTYSALGAQTTTAGENSFSTVTGLDRQTWLVPFSSSTAVGSVRYINYAYKGAFVKIGRAPSVKRAQSFGTNSWNWNIDLLLKGV